MNTKWLRALKEKDPERYRAVMERHYRDRWQKTKARIHADPVLAEKHREWDRKWVERNRDKARQSGLLYRFTHRTKTNAYLREFRASNPSFKRGRALLKQLGAGIRRRRFAESFLPFIGCDYATFERHMESQFQAGMTWDNYGCGDNKWCCDHIRPLASFNLTDDEQAKVCFNYTNTQPLWYRDNCIKHKTDEQKAEQRDRAGDGDQPDRDRGSDSEAMPVLREGEAEAIPTGEGLSRVDGGVRDSEVRGG